MSVITLENLHQKGFPIKYPDINTDAAMKILHGFYQGKTLLALDVTHRAWTLVGKGILVAPLQFPIIKQLAHGCYLLVAKYRQPISHYLFNRFDIGINSCKAGSCYVQQKKTDEER